METSKSEIIIETNKNSQQLSTPEERGSTHMEIRVTISERLMNPRKMH